MMDRVVWHAKRLPKFIEYITKAGKRRLYRVMESKKQDGIGLNAVEPEVVELLEREERDQR